MTLSLSLSLSHTHTHTHTHIQVLKELNLQLNGIKEMETGIVVNCTVTGDIV